MTDIFDDWDNMIDVPEMADEIERLREENERLQAVLGDLVELAQKAMRQANRDGSEYDIDAELEDARAALATANTVANTD